MRAAAQEVDGLVKLFIHKLGIKALHHNVDVLGLGVPELVIHEVNAVADKLAVKGLRTGKVHLGTRVVLVEVHARCHAGGKHVLALAREAEAAQTRDVILTGTGGIVCEVYVFFAEAGEILHQLNGAFINIVAQIKCTVHVEKEQLSIFQLVVIHSILRFSISFARNWYNYYIIDFPNVQQNN